MVQFQHAFGESELQRYPSTHDQTLRPFDAADEGLLSKLQPALNEQPRPAKILLVNDQFGALTVALATHYDVYHWGDSVIEQKAIELNLARNQLPKVDLYQTQQTLPKDIDWVLIKPTKNLAFFAYQLAKLAHAYPTKPILIGVMQKFITNNFREITEKYLCDLNPGRGFKKARIISAHLSAESPPQLAEYNYFSVNDGHSLPEFQVANLPNVFSHTSLDIGARFLLQNFPGHLSPATVADIGCGNGVLAVAASLAFPNATITAIDESFSAVSAATESFRCNQRENGEFVASNLFNAVSNRAFDLILCNPPFHQQRRTTTDTAHKMFKQAAARLTECGQLWIIANRHLGYPRPLNKIFHEVNVVAVNQKFVVIQCMQPINKGE
ncbi:MAG: class I SAM-dependent methyltransferase [Gammaproteobacteria bacterium]|nr:class I SAM-dependent methyltransferase [Gammaproteobacteria bacterium]